MCIFVTSYSFTDHFLISLLCTSKHVFVPLRFEPRTSGATRICVNHLAMEAFITLTYLLTYLFFSRNSNLNPSFSGSQRH